MTQYVGTRISAQVRSHAQKVLKDYSPNAQIQYKSGEDSDDSSQFNDSDISDHRGQNTEQGSVGVQSFIIPREHTQKTDDLNYAVEALDSRNEEMRLNGKGNKKSSLLKVGQKRLHNQINASNDMPENFKRIHISQSVTSNSSLTNQINNCQTFNQQSDNNLLNLNKPVDSKVMTKSEINNDDNPAVSQHTRLQPINENLVRN